MAARPPRHTASSNSENQPAISKNKEMLARWDGLGFVHNDEEMCTHRTLLPDLTT